MNILKKILGVMLIILGISGILLPVLPGWVFVFAGIYLICPNRYKVLKERLIKLFGIKENVV